MVLDIKQARKADVLPIEYIKAAGESIAHVHLSDCSERSMCTPPNEKGLFDFRELFKLFVCKNHSKCFEIFFIIQEKKS